MEQQLPNAPLELLCEGQGRRLSPAGPGSCGAATGAAGGTALGQGPAHPGTGTGAPGRTAQPRSALPRHLGGCDGQPPALPATYLSLPALEEPSPVCVQLSRGSSQPGWSGLSSPALTAMAAAATEPGAGERAQLQVAPVPPRATPRALPQGLSSSCRAWGGQGRLAEGRPRLC